MNRAPAILALAAVAAGGAWALALPLPALAYQPKCQTTGSANTSSSTPGPGQPVEFSATFKDCHGHGQKGQQVTFSSVAPAGCSASFSNQSGTTDSNGSVTTQATLSGQCPAATVLQAQVGGAVAGAAVTAPPNTGPRAPIAHSTTPPRPGFPVVPAVGVLVVSSAAAGGLALRRLRG